MERQFHVRLRAVGSDVPFLDRKVVDLAALELLVEHLLPCPILGVSNATEDSGLAHLLLVEPEDAQVGVVGQPPARAIRAHPEPGQTGRRRLEDEPELGLFLRDLRFDPLARGDVELEAEISGDPTEVVLQDLDLHFHPARLAVFGVVDQLALKRLAAAARGVDLHQRLRPDAGSAQDLRRPPSQHLLGRIAEDADKALVHPLDAPVCIRDQHHARGPACHQREPS